MFISCSYHNALCVRQLSWATLLQVVTLWALPILWCGPLKRMTCKVAMEGEEQEWVLLGWCYISLLPISHWSESSHMALTKLQEKLRNVVFLPAAKEENKWSLVNR